MTPTSELSELFDRDPLKLTEANIDKIVERMRQAQAQYELGVRAPVTERPKAKPKSQATIDLLKDLGLS